MKKVAALILLAVVVSPALAATDWVAVETKGHGSTRDKAIQDGLYLAVCQVQGLTAGGLDAARDGAKTTKKVGAGGIMVSAAPALSQAEASGLVKSYGIADAQKADPNTWEVSLKVQVYDYHSPEDANRLRIAIPAFEPRAKVYNFGNIVVPGKRLGRQFSDVLSSLLLQDGRSTVVNPEPRDTSADPNHSDGASAVADYVLIGTVSQAELTVAAVMDPATGAPSQHYEAAITVGFEVLAGSTRQVLFADQVHLSLEDALVRSLVPISSTDSIDCNQVERQLVQRVATQIADVVSERLFPIRIAAVKDDGMVILDQGGTRLAVGDTFEMFKVGPEMVDTTTGKLLDRDEAGFGTIRIVKVLPRIAYAQFVEGAIGDAAVGAVCRRVRPRAMPVMRWRQDDTVVLTPSGGVKLPVDSRGPSTVIRKR